VRWLASFVCEERGSSIANYERGKRGQRALLRLMDPDDVAVLAAHCRLHLDGGRA